VRPANIRFATIGDAENAEGSPGVRSLSSAIGARMNVVSSASCRWRAAALSTRRTPSRAALGTARLAGTVAFSVFTPDRCVIEKAPLSLVAPD
jgi:hypothetical protein